MIHSHGGTGCGSVHKPFRSSRASLSNLSNTYSPAHISDTTSTSRLYDLGAAERDPEGVALAALT